MTINQFKKNGLVVAFVVFSVVCFGLTATAHPKKGKRSKSASSSQFLRESQRFNISVRAANQSLKNMRPKIR